VFSFEPRGAGIRRPAGRQKFNATILEGKTNQAHKPVLDLIFCLPVSLLIPAPLDPYKKSLSCAAFVLENLLQKANSGSNWRLSSGQVGGTECSFVYHVPGPRGISPGFT